MSIFNHPDIKEARRLASLLEAVAYSHPDIAIRKIARRRCDELRSLPIVRQVRDGAFDRKVFTEAELFVSRYG